MKRRRNLPIIPIAISTDRPHHRRGGGGNGSLLWYAIAGALVYFNWPTIQALFASTPAAAAPTIPTGGGVSYWFRTEDNVVVASHTGIPSPAADPSGASWGTWVPATTAQVQAVLASGMLITIS